MSSTLIDPTDIAKGFKVISTVSLLNDANWSMFATDYGEILRLKFTRKIYKKFEMHPQTPTLETLSARKIITNLSHSGRELQH